MRKVSGYKKRNQRNRRIVTGLIFAVIILGGVCLFVGSSYMSVMECIDALMKKGTAANVRIIWNIRMPRVLAAIITGAGLSVSGLIMQTTLNNPMASPSTLGVSNAAVFGANLSILVFAGDVLSTGIVAFLFSTLSILLILGLCTWKSFTPNVVVLSGMAIGSVWNAATTILQYYATDVGLSAAVVWNFGDLGRATYRTDGVMLLVIVIGIVYFMLVSWKLNALLGGAATAKTMGVNVELLRFTSMLFASVITAICVSSVGIIGFVGIICPHITKKLLGHDHRVTIPASALSGSILLLLADTLARVLGNGSALPVGAITSLLGAPFFVAVIFSGKENRRC